MAKFYVVFFLFLTFSVFIVMMGHFLIYKYLVKIFSVDSLAIKKALASVLAFLSVSFILAMILSHVFENTLIRVFLLLSGFWHGAVVYLLLAIFSTWLIVFFLKIFNLESSIFSANNIGLFALFVTSIIVIFSTHNALNVDIKTIKPEINDLPPAWQGKKAVHLSDLHLGGTMSNNFFQQVVEKTNKQKPDIIFITGDLFDGGVNSLYKYVSGLKSLQAPLGVYFISGNHGTYLGMKKIAPLLEEANIKTLDNHVETVGGVNLLGISYPQHRRGQIVLLAEIKKILSSASKSPVILLYHEPVQIKEIAESEMVDLMLAGHTHRGQLWPFNFITHLVFNGYDYGLHKLGNFNLYTSSGTGVWGPIMRLGSNSEIVVIEF